MSYRGFCGRDKGSMSHASLLDTGLLIDTARVALEQKGKGGLLMWFAVGKGWRGLCSGIRGEWQPSRLRCWELKVPLLLSRVLFTDLAPALCFPAISNSTL